MHIPFFHLNNTSPLEQTIAEGNQPESRNFLSKKTILISSIIAFAILNIVLLFATGVVPTENLPFLQKPSPTPIPDVLLATVGDQKIYKSTVEKALKNQTPAALNNKNAFENTLNKIIENKIFDIEAKKLNIIVTKDQIDNAIKNNNPTSTISASTNLKLLTKYNIIKQQIILKNTASRTAFIIGYWIPPLDDPRIKDYQLKYNQQSSEGNQALNFALQQLKSGNKPQDVVKSIYSKYTSLQHIIAFNGYFYEEIKNRSTLANPRTFTLTKDNINDDFTKELFDMKADEIKKILNFNGSGGSVVQIMTINSGAFKNYDEWLSNKEKVYVHRY